jgi:hypothetical protein
VVTAAKYLQPPKMGPLLLDLFVLKGNWAITTSVRASVAPARSPSSPCPVAEPLREALAHTSRVEEAQAAKHTRKRAPPVHDCRRWRIAESYPRIAADLLNPLLDLLRRSRDACGGDMEKFLIVLAVAIRTSQHPEFKNLSPERLISGELPVFPTLGTNMGSIAASMGMPKETVRRKVLELIQTGWVVRHGRDVLFTAKAYQELVPVRESIEHLALRHFEVVSGCLEEGDGVAEEASGPPGK